MNDSSLMIPGDSEPVGKWCDCKALRAQIEKMKCCANCSSAEFHTEEVLCTTTEYNSYCNFVCNHWKLKE